MHQTERDCAVVVHRTSRMIGSYSIEESFNGLIFDEKEIQPLQPKDCRGLLHEGTMLGTTNRGGPFSPNPDGDAMQTF